MPAFNEASRLPASLALCAEFFETRSLPSEIVVVDDGSTDGTAAAFGEAAQRLETSTLHLRYVRIDHAGKGAAVRHGVRAASGDPVVFLDADLTIPIEIVDAFIDALAAGADIAIASRYVKGSVVRRPWWRRAMGSVFRAFVRAIVPTGLQDTQCGGKAYTAEAARGLFARQRLDGFAFDAEVLFIARRRGLRVVEIPFALTQLRHSSVDFIADAPRMVADLFRIRLNAAFGRYR